MDSTNLTYKLLEAPEWDKLSSLGLQHLPDPRSCYASVAMDSTGIIKAALFLQLAMHLEPLVITPDARGFVNFLRLAATINTYLESSLVSGGSLEYFVHAPNTQISRMAELNKMEKTNYDVYRRIITKEKEG
jgi:hypothetical protein